MFLTDPPITEIAICGPEFRCGITQEDVNHFIHIRSARGITLGLIKARLDYLAHESLSRILVPKRVRAKSELKVSRFLLEHWDWPEDILYLEYDSTSLVSDALMEVLTPSKARGH